MLRTISFVLALGAASPGLAQDADEPVEFAPGAQGDIKPSIGRMIDDAKKLGAEWESRLDILEPDAFGVKPDMDALRDRALNNPRVRALLGADGADTAGQPDAQDRYGSKQAFLLASFSMPETSLRSIMIESQRFGVPIVMRGFVENSVFKTQEALQTDFGDDAETVGFGIDPTMFTRFAVENVPQLIVVKEPLEVCENQGCEGELPPVHDVVRGNIPIEAALELIVRQKGDAANVARTLLEQGRG